MIEYWQDIDVLSIYLHEPKKLSSPCFASISLYLAIIISTAIYTGCSTTTQHPPLPYTRDLNNGNKYYYVKQGDTLFSIGYRSGHGYQYLSAWNSIPPPYKLYAGQRIKLFNPKQQQKSTKIKKPTIPKTKNGTSSQKQLKIKRSLSQKKLTISNDNKSMLKLIWQWPIAGEILNNFSQNNKGIDIHGKPGQQIRATAKGKVVYSGSGLTGYGNLLIIKHNQEFLSAYSNNRVLLVKEGQIVKMGQIIAEIGQAKNKQSSLHFEIRKNGNPVNPLHYLPNK